MKRTTSALWLACAATVVCGPMTSLALAREDAKPAAAAEALPTGKEIMEKHITASGGRDAMLKIKNRVSKGELDFPAQGIKAQIESTTAAPNYMTSVMTIPNMMTMKTGSDGTDVWQASDTMGSRLLEGKELENQLRDATFNSDLEWERLYKTVNVIGVEDIDGKPAYKVETISPNDSKMTHWFDKESGIRVKISIVQMSQMGEIPVETLFQDYRDVDGVKVPFKTQMSQGGMSGTLTMTEVKHNVDLPADFFAMPAEVKALKEQQAKPADAPMPTEAPKPEGK